MTRTQNALAGVVAILTTISSATVHPQSSSLSALRDHEARLAFVNQYCVTCHSNAMKSGGVVLQGISAMASTNPTLWEKVVHKVDAGEMPPPLRPRPDAQAAKSFTTSLIRELDAYAFANPYAGRPVVRRLNRTEYSNAIRDLLALDIPVATDLPDDGTAAGFDNIGDALSISPVLLERYLKVARRVTDLAIGTGESSPVTDQFFPAKTQATWQGDEMPFGSRGGIAIRYFFPRTAEYTLRVFLDSNDGALTSLEGVRFFQHRVRIAAGIHSFVATFPDDFAAREGPAVNVAGVGGAPLGGPVDPEATAIKPVFDFLLDGQRLRRFDIGGALRSEISFGADAGPPIVERAEISGPYNPTGVGHTVSRERIFVCRPARQSDEASCATNILSVLVRRAFRRDVTTSEMRPFIEAYRTTRVRNTFDESIAAALRRILVAPDFLFRLEMDPPNVDSARPYRITQFELASRISFFLWSSIPDDELLNVASRGKLTDGRELEQQMIRMLADRRAQSLVDNFASQWLRLRALADVRPDAATYPEYDEALGADFQKETQLFVQSVVRENRSVLDLVGADYTFVNERLAKLYGVPGVIGPGFRRVSLASMPDRGGLLSQGSVLMMTSHTTRTSPVLRGNWILTYLLNAPPPPPPPGVPPLDESDVDGKRLTTRQQVERHRRNPACASCHSRIDPLGFALESFDVIGRLRSEDAGGQIDPSGTLPTGETLSGPAGLKKFILSREERFARATVSRVMTYALGRQLDARDQPAVRQIVRATQAGRYKFNDLVLGIITSVPFRMRQVQERS